MRYFNYGVGLAMTNRLTLCSSRAAPAGVKHASDMDIARSIQDVTEIMFRMAKHVRAKLA
jgi:hypothetical protein